jgi:hypothetical protein
MPRPLSTIAADICKAWRDKDGKPCVNYAAKPYLEAMADLDSIADRYGADDAKSIVAYFLGNASTFRGEQAKALKAELKAML